MTRSDIYEKFVNVTCNESVELVQLNNAMDCLDAIGDMSDDAIEEGIQNNHMANIVMKNYRRVLKTLIDCTDIRNIVYEKLDLEREFHIQQCIEEVTQLYNQFKNASDYE